MSDDAAGVVPLSGLRCRLGSLLLLACGTFGAACAPSGKRPLGAECGDSAECGSGLCIQGNCVDPLADDDQDGLNNGLEGQLGSNSQDPDSDSDGVIDPDELDPGRDLVDTDGDGRPDIVESVTADSDGDCITDQFDARDGTPDSDPSPMLSQVCRALGVCAEQAGLLRVSCETGTAACIYADVAGYSNPESACDQRDENCDGQVDEAFPRGCQRTVHGWLAPATSGGWTASAQYRASLVTGPPIAGTTASAKHRVVLGQVPALPAASVP